MADVNQVITLGIGTPSDIEHFILVGIGVGEEQPHTKAPECRTFIVPAEDRTVDATEC